MAERGVEVSYGAKRGASLSPLVGGAFRAAVRETLAWNAA